MGKRIDNLKIKLGNKMTEIGEKLSGKEKEENDYYVRYKKCIHVRLNPKEKDEKMEAFLTYFDNTYEYVQNKRKELQNNYFHSEGVVLKLGLLITIMNSLLAVINGFIAPETPLVIIKDIIPKLKVAAPIYTACITSIAGYLTYKQAKNTKMKYHETWIRHTIHYSRFNIECRDFAESLNDYSKLKSDQEKKERFIKRIYEISDEDFGAFLGNIQKLED